MFGLFLKSDVRNPLPKGLCPPERNAKWVVLIGHLYRGHHPLLMFENYSWLSDGEMDKVLHYEVAHIGGVQPPYPDIPA